MKSADNLFDKHRSRCLDVRMRLAATHMARRQMLVHRGTPRPSDMQNMAEDAFCMAADHLKRQTDNRNHLARVSCRVSSDQRIVSVVLPCLL